jgi:predicted glutamine amidotransferase
MRPLARRALLLLVAGARACRFMIYVGEQPVDGREFLLDTENNLLSLATEPPLVPAAKLSPRFNATQFALRNAELNLDGYGVSWYEAGEPFPRRVRSAAPVVDHGEPDATLAALLRGDAVPTLFRASMDSCVEEPLAPPKVELRSRAIFAHVRAASPFAEISEKNSHPFAFQTLAWLHNGAVHGFERIRDELLAATRPAARSLVAGSTDSEIAGAVFADHLAGFPPCANRIFNPTSMCAYSTQALRLCSENSMRAIDSSRNQPNRLRFDRSREFQCLVGTSRTSG